MEFVLLYRFCCAGILLLVNYSSFIVSSASSVTAVNSSIERGGMTWNTSHDGRVLWRTGCDFTVLSNNDFIIRSRQMTTIEKCIDQCLHESATCNHFYHTYRNGGYCYLLWAIEEQKSLERTGNDSWSCGFIPSQMWNKSMSHLKKNSLFKRSLSSEELFELRGPKLDSPYPVPSSNCAIILIGKWKSIRCQFGKTLGDFHQALS